MKKHYETHVEDTDKLISVAGPVLDYKSWYEQYRKLMEEQAQRKHGLYTPTSEGDDDDFPSISGITARYSASGLTNEQMAANPVWVDKTGNGHDIQLKNLAWGGMSGVGGYEMNFNLWRNNVSGIPDISMSTTTTSVSVSVGNSTYNNNLIYIHISNWDINKNHWLKVTSTYEDGDLAFIFYNDSNTKKIGLPANGYVNIPAYPEFKGNYMYISTISNKQGSFTIEQIPEYEGYLVTDGVDDEVRSAAFTLNEDWTIVGNWEFITNENKNAGLTKVYSLYLYNRDYGIFVYKYINAGQGFSVEDVKSLKAICSDGRIYLNDWQEIRNNIEQEATISKGVMAIGYFNRDFTKMAFKNLGIYNNQLLSKDDCIKAYNYLQTLKAK